MALESSFLVFVLLFDLCIDFYLGWFDFVVLVGRWLFVGVGRIHDCPDEGLEGVLAFFNDVLVFVEVIRVNDNVGVVIVGLEVVLCDALVGFADAAGIGVWFVGIVVVGEGHGSRGSPHDIGIVSDFFFLLISLFRFVHVHIHVHAHFRAGIQGIGAVLNVSLWLILLLLLLIWIRIRSRRHGHDRLCRCP